MIKVILKNSECQYYKSDLLNISSRFINDQVETGDVFLSDIQPETFKNIVDISSEMCFLEEQIMNSADNCNFHKLLWLKLYDDLKIYSAELNYLGRDDGFSSYLISGVLNEIAITRQEFYTTKRFPFIAEHPIRKL